MKLVTTILRNFPKYYFRKRSYAQAGEDVLIKFIFNELMGISKPTYIDVGAYHPFHLSNTALLYQTGSYGINIEPNPLQYAFFTKHRKRDINLNIGISDSNDILNYYQLKYPTLNTFLEEEANRYKNDIIGIKEISVRTIADVLSNQTALSNPDLLSIDVEGLDERIIKTIDFESFAPKIICIESVDNFGNGKWRRNNNIIEFIKSKGYLHYADTMINSIFVKKQSLHVEILDLIS